MSLLLLWHQWAHGSAHEFVRLHREALESEFVSNNINRWIDLIFGFQQSGAAAEAADNVFFHFTYEGAVDVTTITDPIMRRAVEVRARAPHVLGRQRRCVTWHRAAACGGHAGSCRSKLRASGKCRASCSSRHTPVDSHVRKPQAPAGPRTCTAVGPPRTQAARCHRHRHLSQPSTAVVATGTHRAQLSSMIALRHVHRCYVLHTKHTSPVVRLLFTRSRATIISIDAEGNAVFHR